MAKIPERVLLLRHPGFLDRFIACVFEQADKPLVRTIGWNTLHFHEAKRFDPSHAAEQSQRYEQELGSPYRIIVANVTVTQIESWEEGV